MSACCGGRPTPLPEALNVRLVFPSLGRQRWIECLQIIHDLHIFRTDFRHVAELCSRLRKMFKKVPEEIEFYFPQICDFLMTFQGEPFSILEDTILYMCSLSFHFSLMLYWFLHGVIKDVPCGSEFNRAARLQLCVEAAVIFRDLVDEGRDIGGKLLSLMLQQHNPILESTSPSSIYQSTPLSLTGPLTIPRKSYVNNNLNINGDSSSIREDNNDLKLQVSIVQDDGKNNGGGGVRREGIERVTSDATTTSATEGFYTPVDNAKHTGESPLPSPQIDEKREQSTEEEGGMKISAPTLASTTISHLPPSPAITTLHQLVATAAAASGSGNNNLSSSPQPPSHHLQQQSNDNEQDLVRSPSSPAVFSPPAAVATPSTPDAEKEGTERRDALLKHFREQGRRRRDFFHGAIDWIAALTTIAYKLRYTPAGEMRKEELRSELTKLVDKIKLIKSCYIPLCSSGDPFERVVGICIEECKVFSTKERAPYMLFVETLRSKRKTGAPDTGWALSSFWHRKPKTYGTSALQAVDSAEARERKRRETRSSDPSQVVGNGVAAIGEGISRQIAHMRRTIASLSHEITKPPYWNMDRSAAGSYEPPPLVTSAERKQGEGEGERENGDKNNAGISSYSENGERIDRGYSYDDSTIGGGGGRGGADALRGSLESLESEEGQRQSFQSLPTRDSIAEEEAVKATPPPPARVTMGPHVMSPGWRKEPVARYGGAAGGEGVESSNNQENNNNNSNNSNNNVNGEGDEKQRMLVDPSAADNLSVPREGEVELPEKERLALENVIKNSSRNDIIYASDIGSLHAETWKQKRQRIKTHSSLGKKSGWELRTVVVKSNDDLRQEVFAMQLIQQIDRIWRDAGLNLKLKPYQIISTGADTGLIEGLADAISIDALKKMHNNAPLVDIFKKMFGNNTSAFHRVCNNFMESLAAYSIICYILQIKDRHNGNILVDSVGHLIHIDFGFLLCTSPGNMGFETAPFKFTQEYLDVLGGKQTVLFQKFLSLCIQGFLALRSHHERVIALVEMMMPGCRFECLRLGRKVVDQMTARFALKLEKKEFVAHILELIDISINSRRTRHYDQYQWLTNGITF